MQIFYSASYKGLDLQYPYSFDGFILMDCLHASQNSTDFCEWMIWEILQVDVWFQQILSYQTQIQIY